MRTSVTKLTTAVALGMLGMLGCEPASRAPGGRQPRSAANGSAPAATAAHPASVPAAAGSTRAAAAPTRSSPGHTGSTRPAAGADDSVYEPAASTSPAPPTTGEPPATSGQPSHGEPLRTGSCRAELACSALGSASPHGGKATLSVRLAAGKVVSLDYRSECSPPISYAGHRDDLAVDAAIDDWLVIELSVGGALPGRSPEEGYQPATHEESRSFRIRANELEWAEPASRIATTGPCTWQ
jgi:hypothetical protein